MAKPNFTLPNKPAIKSGGILSYNYTDDFTFVPAPLTFNRDSAATRVNEKGLIEDVGYFGPELVQNGDFSEIGSELINLDTAVYQSGWQNNNDGSATFDINNGGGSEVTQIGVLQVGKTYKFSYDINFTGAGQLRLYTQTFLASVVDQSGTYTGTFVADGTNIRFKRINGNLFTIDNVSVKEVDPNNYWILAGSNVSISNNKLNFVNAVTNSEFAQQVIVAPIGKTYKITLEVSNLGSGETIKIRHPYQDTTINSNGLHTVYGVGDYANFFRITPNSSTATFSIDNISVIEVLGDKPRIDYSDSLTEPSLLLEPQSTNLTLNSNDLTNSTWEISSATTSSSTVVNPEGTSGASLYTCNNYTGNNQFFRIPNGFYGNNVAYTYSVFVKYNSFQYCKLAFTNFTPPYDQSPYFAAVFDIVNGLVTTTNSVGNPTNTNSSIVDYGNGWFRISISAALSPSSGSFNFEFNKSPNAIPTFENFGRINQTTTTDDKVYVYGGQLEQLPYATSYISTAGSTATRLGETANNAGDVNVFNSEEGVLYAEIFKELNQSTTTAIGFSVSSGRLKIYITSSGKLEVQLIPTSGDSVNFYNNSIDLSIFNKVAFRYNSNGENSLFLNGVKIATTTGVSFSPSILNSLNFDFGNGSEDFYGKVRNVKVFNKALTDRELEILTIQ